MGTLCPGKTARKSVIDPPTLKKDTKSLLQPDSDLAFPWNDRHPSFDMNQPMF
jgi:hypothetical protein